MDLMVVDDHPLVIEGLQMILADTEFNVIADSSNISDAIDKYEKYKPELSLVDLRLGKENGLSFIEKAKELNHNSKFVIFSSDADRKCFDKSREMSVDGYILKDAFPEELVYALKVVGKGRKYYDPKLMDYVMHDDKVDDKISDITSRELEILEELGKGNNNKLIAENLFISEHTVKKHVSRILSKLELEDRTQAALYANKHNISAF